MIGCYKIFSVKILFFNLATVQPNVKHHALEKVSKNLQGFLFLNLNRKENKVAVTICFQVRIPISKSKNRLLEKMSYVGEFAS